MPPPRSTGFNIDDMRPERIADFDLPWIHKLLAEKDIVVTGQKQDRVPPEPILSKINGAINPFLAEVLNTNDTVPALRFVWRDATPSTPREFILLISFGGKVEGAPGLMHGGVICYLFDHIAGMVAITELGKPVTLDLRVKYKAPIPIPSVVKFSARVAKADGKKRIITGSVEDGEGKVYAEMECLYYDLKARL